MAVLLIVGGGWFYSHYRLTMRMQPDKAAIQVAKRFESSPAGNYSARQVDSMRDDDSGRERRTFIVSRDGKEVARVAVRPFFRLGWQEQVYERIEPSAGANK